MHHRTLLMQMIAPNYACRRQSEKEQKNNIRHQDSIWYRTYANMMLHCFVATNTQAKDRHGLPAITSTKV